MFLATIVFAQPGPPGGESATNNFDLPSNTVPGYGTNLWLSITLSNHAVQLLLHNTQPGVPYLIRSRADLISGAWLSETTVTGAVAATITPIVLNTGEPTNSLFIQALTWVTNAFGGTTAMLAIGGGRIMELTANGDVISWGGNQYGELGDDTFLDSTNPVHVAGLTGITRIASGLNHSLALDSDGTVWAWGRNSYGQLGDDVTDNANVPVQVLGMTNAMAIAAHGYNSEGPYALSAAVRSDGTVWMWGCSQCIVGGGYSPAQIAGISNAIAVAVGDCHGVALLTNGAVWMWGNGNDVPLPVSGLSNIVAICAGDFHTLALASNGTVWAWGYNFYGQLGDGRAENYSGAPVKVAGVTNATGIAACGWHSLALDAQGSLWAWGNDFWGQLGDGGSAGIVTRPVRVPGLSNIVCVAAGAYASAALDGNGHLWQWGGTSDGPFASWNDEDGHPRLSPVYADFYSGQLPDLQVLNGNNQTPHAGLEFPQPLVFKVTDANGAALSNAPVSVEVVAGDMTLRTPSGGSDYRGLRLITDANGEVALIGFAGRYAGNINCQVRALAASRERIAEADFNETLILPPTISITSPPDGANVLVGSNQGLTLTVDAQAAPGATIREVDYSYHINGGAETSLAISTQSPYSFAWTEPAWWTNAFFGQYTLSAVAVDDAGAQSDPQSVNLTVALDSDGNGMPDYWQLRHFGHCGVDPNADADDDGIGNLQEYEQGTGPTDFYNGRLPWLEIAGGNDQAGNYDSFLPQPVSIKVSGSQFFDTFITNAPVTFTVTNGTALLAATTNDTPASSLLLRSDLNGQVSAWVYFPPSSSNPPDSTILVSAASGASSVSVTVNEFIPLARWRFNDTNTWAGEAGQLPLLADNVAGVPSWSSSAVSVDGANPAVLSYNVVETNGRTNINCQVGSVLFWFKPDWSSANVGGNGPGAWGRLLEMGNYNPAFTNGWWSLYLNPDGTQLLFATAANGGAMTNLSGAISWYSNEWHQIALTCSPTGSALYVDGLLLATGAGVTDFPNADELANGFRIGSDENGNNQAAGAFDELETFNYPLAAANTWTHGSVIPDWWEIKYFAQAGMDPDFQPDNDGFSLVLNYLSGRYPNVINFSLTTTNGYVTNLLVPVQIRLQGGVPFGMAVAVNTTNLGVAPYQLLDINSNFVGTPWHPYDSNMVVSLNSGDGDYYVWVGLRGLSHDASITWHGTRLTLDTAPPTLTITNPAAGVVSKAIIQLQGCANESLSSLTYDVSNAAGVWTNQPGYVTGQFCDPNLLAITTNYFQCYNVVLTSNGVNAITLRATDLAGNTTTTNFGFTFDASANTNPPALTVLWPQNEACISGSNFTLQAQVSDPMATVTASIADASGNTNFVQGLVEQNGLAWVQNLPLANGTNTLTITATDAAGNTAAANLTLVRSRVIVTMNPPAGDQLNQSFVSVSGTVSDSSCALTVNGVTAAVNADGAWEADNVPASSSGTALFDVEVYSGGAPSLVHGNLHFDPKTGVARSSDAFVAATSVFGFNPMDAPSGANDGSQLFAMALPVKLGLMSYLSGTFSYGMIAGGRYCAVNPCCGPAFANNADTINWTYQAGGSDSGYDYCSGYFNSGPGSPGGMMLCAPQDSVWANPLPAGKDAYGAPWENVSDAQNYVRTHVMIESQGQIAAGTAVTYLVQAQAWDANGRGQLEPDSLRIGGVTLTDDGAGSGFMLLSAPAGVNVDVTPMAAGNYTFNVQAQQLNLQLAVDNNRDGKIYFDNRDATTPLKPYRFWINDSQEHGDDETSAGADDQIPGSSAPNYSQNHVQGRSDVVNFFPIVLQMGGVLQQLPPEDGYEYHLYQADGALKILYTSLTPDTVFDYLTDTGNAENYGAIAGYDPSFNPNSSGLITYTTLDAADLVRVSSSPSGLTLNPNFLARIQSNGGKGVILVEGIANTSKPLMLEIWRNGRLLAGTPLYLSISGVEQMFRHVNFSYVNGTVEVPARADAPNEPHTNDKNFVFLHGYNVNQQEARGVLSEVFKRMYWSGSKAKFYGVTWNGEESQWSSAGFTPNYHTNVVNALQTASHLADFLGTLPADKTAVAAHSLGNMVVLSAISDYHAAPGKYFMIDAAVPMEAVQGNAVPDPHLIHPDWIPYANRLFASYWWQLFPTDDARSSLTWNNRLGNLGDVDIYNFYSSGEEVLREYTDGYPPSEVGGSIAQVRDWFANEFLNIGKPLGTYVWAWQEMLKGRGAFDGLIGSTHGGWRFPVNEYGDPNPVPPSTANNLPDATLRQTPVFTFGSRFDQIDGPFPDLALLGPDGSTYAQANRDRILSDAIPALTLPVGANPVPALIANGRNFNLTSENFESGWPEARLTGGEQNNNWHHSDFDYVAYPFTHQLFNKMVTFGNLK